MQTLDEQEHLGISKPNQVAGQAQGSLPEMQEPFIFCITSHFWSNSCQDTPCGKAKTWWKAEQPNEEEAHLTA